MEIKLLKHFTFHAMDFDFFFLFSFICLFWLRALFLQYVSIFPSWKKIIKLCTRECTHRTERKIIISGDVRLHLAALVFRFGDEHQMRQKSVSISGSIFVKFENGSAQCSALEMYAIAAVQVLWPVRVFASVAFALCVPIERVWLSPTCWCVANGNGKIISFVAIRKHAIFTVHCAV